MLSYSCPALFRRGLVALAFATASAAAAADTLIPVRITYDDSRNPSPHKTIYYCCQWDPATGEYADDWQNFARRPMHDDGTGGDAKAGDHIWTVVDKLKPNPGRLMWWGADSDTDPGNEWLGSCGSILAESGAPVESLARSMPDEAYQTPEDFATSNGFQLGVAAPPRLLGESGRILFTFRTSDAKNVYLAGDFNGYARNKDGKTSDPQSLMYKGTNDVWYRTMRIEGDEIKFKYVLEYPDGLFRWVSDPNVKDTDKDGNSVLRRTALLDAVPPAPKPKAETEPAIRWRVYDATLLDQLRSREGQVLLYVRMKGNQRCREFEKSYLLNKATRMRFGGRTILYVESDDVRARDFLKQLRIQRVPALAYMGPSGEWKTMTWMEDTATSVVANFLDEAAGGAKPTPVP